MKIGLIILGLFFLLFSCSKKINAPQKTLIVPNDFDTIQKAIDNAENEQIILVNPGIYAENLNFFGKKISVVSKFYFTKDTTFINETIIDGNENGSVVTFESGEDTTTVLSGFTIQNGMSGAGGGIFCIDNSSPTLEFLRIWKNKSYNGGGIGCYNNSNPLIQSVVIDSNISISNPGGGISAYLSSPSLEDVNIIGNSSDDGGGIYCHQSRMKLIRVKIANNNSTSGGGIYSFQSKPKLENVLIYNNSASQYGGGIYCYDSSPEIINATISSNTAFYGGKIFLKNDSEPVLINCIFWGRIENDIYFSSELVPNTLNVSYSDIQNGLNAVVLNDNGEVIFGEGCIDANPAFVNLENNDYHLSYFSPCIDAGNPASNYNDFTGSRNDMGAFGGPNGNW
ncbi:MAG: hypothetical protein DRZ79_02145 [Candidatus Cloacimonadota bacterium]|nr:MAG: hypothetical protein DRZ79_02145 [Candidatus Cloacimonadota bacterium]